VAHLARASTLRVPGLLPAALLAASLAGCCAIVCRAKSPPAEAAGSVVGTLQRLIDGDNARDLETVLSCYTDDVTWLPPGEPSLHGKDAIRERYEKLFAGFTVEFTLEIAEATTDGSTGYASGTTHGTLTPAGGGEPMQVNDHFLAVLRCEDGTWRVARLAWSPQQHAP
jgi:uncharacterized protein (TIGR02246 family)